MTSIPEPQPPRPDPTRELLGLFLILAGAAAIVLACWLVDPRLGVGMLGAGAVAAGVALTFREE